METALWLVCAALISRWVVGIWPLFGLKSNKRPPCWFLHWWAQELCHHCFSCDVPFIRQIFSLTSSPQKWPSSSPSDEHTRPGHLKLHMKGRWLSFILPPNKPSHFFPVFILCSCLCTVFFPPSLHHQVFWNAFYPSSFPPKKRLPKKNLSLVLNLSLIPCFVLGMHAIDLRGLCQWMTAAGENANVAPSSPLSPVEAKSDAEFLWKNVVPQEFNLQFHVARLLHHF